MSPSRRAFLWTMGTAAGGLALVPVAERLWPPEETDEGPGWAPGIEEHLASVCLLCPARCGIRGRVVDGKLVGIQGNRFHPMNRGGVCSRGVAGVQMLYHPDRIASPLVRTGDGDQGRWRQASTGEVVEEISGRLRELRDAGRPEAVAGLTGYAAGSMQDVWDRFFEAFGSPNHVKDAYDDGTDGVMEAMHGIHRRPGYDLEHADTVVSFGAPLFESWWSPLQAYAAFGRSGAEGERQARFIQVDHRFSNTAAHADEWVGVKVGTHAVLALGMAYIILRDRLHDEDFLAQHVSGFEDFTDQRGETHEGFRSLVMRRYRTEEVSSATGVSVERITSLARAFANGGRSVAVCGPDVTLSPSGLTSGVAVHSLNLLVGSVGRGGGVLFGDDPPLAPLATLVRDSVGRLGRSREPLAGSPPTFGPGDQSVRFAEAVAAADVGTVQVLFVHGVDPVGSSRRSDVWERALAKIPLVVSFSPFLDETTRRADVVVPDLLPWERWQDAPTPSSFPYPVWGVSRPLVTPNEGATHTGEILFALARAVGGSVAESLPYGTFQELLQSRARGLYEAHRGRTLAGDFEMEGERQREARGWWLPNQSDFDAFWSELVERGGWADLFYDDTDPKRFAHTPDGRIALMPQAVLSTSGPEGAPGEPYAPTSADTGEPSADFPLRLQPYRVSTLASDTLSLERWLAEQPAVFPTVQWVPWVSVAPSTVREIGLDVDRLVWVISPRGRYRALLFASPGVPPGTVVAPFGLRHPDGEQANPLALLGDASDPQTGMPAWFNTRVRLDRA